MKTGRFTEAPAAHRTRLARAGAAAEGALVRGLAVRPAQRTRTPDALLAELTGRAKPRRVYDADEVNAIVRKAADLEVSAPTSSGAMTIGGVEALAAEVGIKPELVRSAAGSMSRGPPRAAPASSPSSPRPTGSSSAARRAFCSSGWSTVSSTTRVPRRGRRDPPGHGHCRQGEPARAVPSPGHLPHPRPADAGSLRHGARGTNPGDHPGEPDEPDRAGVRSGSAAAWVVEAPGSSWRSWPAPCTRHFCSRSRFPPGCSRPMPPPAPSTRHNSRRRRSELEELADHLASVVKDLIAAS